MEFLRWFDEVFKRELRAATTYSKPKNTTISYRKSRSTRERRCNFFGQLFELKVDTERHPRSETPAKASLHFDVNFLLQD
jgi:hypothetical protein